MSFDQYKDEYLADGCDDEQADELASLECMIDADEGIDDDDEED